MQNAASSNQSSPETNENNFNTANFNQSNKRVHYQDNMSDHQPDEEVHDIVHDLGGQQINAAKQQLHQAMNYDNGGLGDALSAEDLQKMNITSSSTMVQYSCNMEASYEEFDNHALECNVDFKENILRKVQTIKLKDTSELNKKVEELKL